MSKNYLELYTPAGIGDTYWVLMKILENVDKPIKLIADKHANISCCKFLKNIDGIGEAIVNPTPFVFENAKIEYEKYKNIKSSDLEQIDKLYLECNKWLESGKRIETYLPNLNTTFIMPWKLNVHDYKEVSSIIKKKTVVFYVSGIDNNKTRTCGNNWKIDRWYDMIKFIRKNYNVNIVVIGGGNDDETMYPGLQNIDKELKIFHNRESTFIIPLLRECSCFISYQSGLSCISIAERIPTYMLYFSHLKDLYYTFCDKRCITDKKLYFPISFEEDIKNNMNFENWIEQHLK